MLRQLLQLIGDGELRTQRELAAALQVPDALIAQMVERLARDGYLAEAWQCAKGCEGCPVKTACGAQRGLRFWTLTDKGRMASEESGIGNSEAPHRPTASH